MVIDKEYEGGGYILLKLQVNTADAENVQRDFSMKCYQL